jgi:anthranilate synthase component 2
MPPRILIVDNFDSFTFNLYHYLLQCNVSAVDVVRNNEDLIQIAPNYDAFVLSPGPGLPHDAGNMPELIREFASKKPFLGVCLGHQALALHFGAQLENMEEVIHGRESNLFQVDFEDVIFRGLQSPVTVGRYHSWVVANDAFPTCLKVTSIDSKGLIMSYSHIYLPICGVQFHPESIMTNQGLQMINNWIDSIQ